MLRPAAAALMDESPRASATLEWWFFHGRFAGAGVDERHFVVSLFRFEVPGADNRPADAFLALMSVLDPLTGRQRTSTRVDARVPPILHRRDAARPVDPYSPEASLEELRTYGLPREFTCPDDAPALRGDPLHFRWADLALDASADGIVLEFHDPDTARPLHLRMTPAAPRLTIDVAAAVGEPHEAMQYVTYPRMHIRGSAGGRAVEGEGWFDHQWGGRAWMQSGESPPRPRGWEWLGISLDDGSDWVLATHWDARTHQEAARHLTVRDASGEVRVYRTFDLEPLRWWTSPATRVRYPVEWKVALPERQAELVFTPLADHQEIRIFGPQRAVWEGAGRVRGRIGDRPVEGSARLEINGLGYLFDISGYLRGWAEPVDSALAAFLPRSVEEHDVRRFAGPPEWIYEPCSYTSMLSAPLWDLLARNGKRWRAVLAFLLLDILGRDPAPIRDVLFIIPELLHNASLIIDDIQDDALLRRGEEAIHRRYGLDVAISAANTAYFLPLVLVLDHAALTGEEKNGISRVYQRSLVRTHLGQSLDIFWSHTVNETQFDRWLADSIGPKILQMYALKTAAPVEGAAEAAALLAGAADPVRAAILRFARALGVAFQLVDDVNNFTDSPTWGKERGEDLRTGKLTYVIVRALHSLPPADRAVLRQILCRPDLRADPGALRTGIELIVGSGACGGVREEARAMVGPAWDRLSQHIPPSIAKMELRTLWEGLLGTPFREQEFI
ncbi:MAG: polyprenyl synthetase family protein [bacterium]